MKNSILKLLIRIFSNIIPKKRRLVVFLPHHDINKFSGNLKALFLYTIKESNVQAVFLAQSKEVYFELKRVGLPVKLGIFSKIWFLSRAQILVIDATIGYLSCGNLRIVQLWHGTGFKNIGLLNDNLSISQELDFKKHYSKYKIVVSTSDSDKQRKQICFNSDNVMITGSPRNDLFFHEDSYLDNIRLELALNSFDKIITYVPTFRDFETVSPFSDIFWEQLNCFLKKNNYVFLIKKHPWDKYLSCPSKFSNIKDYTTKVRDVQDLLLVTDLLISDYSGIVTDYVLTNKPMIFYWYDIVQYQANCRSMYYDIEQILPGPFTFDEASLLSKIENLGWFNDKDYTKNYKDFQDMFHFYQDGNSCKRILNNIEQLF